MGQAVVRTSRIRWLASVCVLVAASLLQPVTWARAVAGEVLGVTAGAGPVDRPAPTSARPDEAVPPDK